MHRLVDISLTMIQSKNPYTPPSVYVNYFSIDFDLSVQVAGARLSRKIFASPPLRSALLPRLRCDQSAYVRTSRR